jgi:guanylate kinase
MKQKKDIIIIDGPRGIGKDTIVRHLLKRRFDIKKIVTNATREPREGEIDGVDYFFITEKEFLEKVKSGDIFEYSTSIYGSYRGMSKAVIDSILKSGKIAIVTPDIVGVRALKKIYPNRTVSIFITAPKELIQKRLETGNAPDIQARLNDYEGRHKHIDEYDFIVTNDGTSNEAVEKVIKILEGQNGK